MLFDKGIDRLNAPRRTGSESAQPGPWKPVLSGAAAERALSAARDLGNAIVRCSDEGSQDAGLARGFAGRAVALAYLGRALHDRELEAESRSHLERAIELVSEQRMTVSLMQGFTGVAWAVAHLEDDPSATKEIDDALLQILSTPPWRGEYDLVSGLVGLGIYGLERSGSEGRAIVELVVERLGELAEDHPNGLRWFTPPEFILAGRLGRAPHGFYNLGTAHGVPGVISLLADAIAAEVASERAAALLDGAVRYLLSEQLESGEVGWPYYVGRDVDVSPSRLAWCYGDPGIVLSLQRAQASGGGTEWREALDHAFERLKKRPRDHGGVQGASLCHGSAGLAHIYARLGHATDDPWWIEAAADRLEETLSLRSPEGSMAGYKVWEPSTEKHGDVQGPGFLAGIAGIALALVAAAGDLEPEWDRVLGLSGPRIK